MKGKKLLAGIISAAMILSTMSFTVFASETVTEVSTSDEFIAAIKADDASTKIKLMNDITLNTVNGSQPTQREITKDCTIDLGEYTLDKGTCNFLYTSKNVKFTGVKGSAKMTWTSIADSFVRGNANSLLTFENIEFTGPESSCYIVSIEGANCAMNIINCTMENITAGYAPVCSNNVDAYINIKDSTISVADTSKKALQNGKYVISGNSTITGKIYTTNDIYTIGNNVSLDSSVVVKTAKVTVTSSNGVVKAFENFEDALAAAQANDTITLYDDVTLTSRMFGSKALTIDLNEKTMTMPEVEGYSDGAQYYFNADTTFKNGNINITAGATTATFYAYENNPSLTLDKVVVTAKNISGCYLFNNFRELNIINNSEIKVSSESGTNEIISVIAANDNNRAINIENSKIDVKNIIGKVILYGNVTIKGTSEINADITGDGIRVGNFEGDALKIKKTSDGAPVINISVKDDDKVRHGIRLAADTEYTVDPEATVNATVTRDASAENLANTVKVSFEDVTENEGEKVYNLYLESDSDKTINRLTAAQLAFVFGTEDDLNFVVSGTDKVSVSNESGMYLFNFNGKTAADDTGVKIQLGQIKVTGYGEFRISFDMDKENKAHATEIADNIVTDFVVAATEEQGTLELPESITDVITVPTRKLTINITFPNAVKDNAKAYQDMKVTIKGGEYDKTFALGSDETAMVDGAYKLEEDLEKDTPYTVTVSGAGYRTAYYTVTMNADKTLNFWNNAKDTAMEVEEDKAASAKKVTFLAGDLVNDGKINIYDLSAVVSYFGTNNTVTAASEYAKYDLNRDGKIDSKDVAYVLVSWGK